MPLAPYVKWNSSCSYKRSLLIIDAVIYPRNLFTPVIYNHKKIKNTAPVSNTTEVHN